MKLSSHVSPRRQTQKQTKDTRKRTENAGEDRTKNRDSSSARVDDGPTSLTFGITAKPLLKAPEKRIRDALAKKGAEAPKPHFPPVEVHMLLSTAGGLMPTGTVFTLTMRAIFPPHFFSWSLGEETKKRTGRTNFNQLTPLC